MSAPVLHPEVRSFVAAVRAALDDLGPDEVEELTGGLEADLDDALTDTDTGTVAAQGDLRERLGDPVAYAAELRAAAGLPPRTVGGEWSGVAGRLGGLAARSRREWDGAVQALESWRRWPLVREYGLALQPAWWVLRAWVLFQVMRNLVRSGYGSVLPLSVVGWLTLLVLVGASVEAGRRTRRVRAAGSPAHVPGRVARLLVLGNVLAVLALPFALHSAEEQIVVYGQGYPVPPSNGVWLNGVEVRNVFPYDAQGRPLSGVQLFDENGNRLEVGESARTPLPDAEGTMVAQVPAVGQDSLGLWNVFPLRQQVIPPYPDGSQPAADRTRPYPAPRPTPSAGPLLAPTGEGGSTPTSAPTPSPTPSPAPSVAPSPTQDPTTP